MSEQPVVDPQSDTVTAPNCVPIIGAVRVPSSACHSYRPGHNIHQIHMRHASTKGEWEPAMILELEGNTIAFEVSGEVKRGWNHDARVLRAMKETAEIDPASLVQWCSRYSILLVSLAGSAGAYSAYLSEEGERCIAWE